MGRGAWRDSWTGAIVLRQHNYGMGKRLLLPRSKVNGRVVREYVGGGKLANSIAQMDALERQQRRPKYIEQRQEKDKLGVPRC